jgi:hypothetical protein
MGLFGLRRTLGMAAGGGALGYMNTGDLGGIAGGAAGGALFGAVGFPMGRNFLARRGKLAGLAGRGAGFLERGALGAASRAGGYAQRYGPMTGVATRGGIAANRVQGWAGRAATGLAMGGEFIGRNAVMTNKIGGGALAALGLGASAHIGSSVISSNRGF